MSAEGKLNIIQETPRLELAKKLSTYLKDMGGCLVWCELCVPFEVILRENKYNHFLKKHFLKATFCSTDFIPAYTVTELIRMLPEYGVGALEILRCSTPRGVIFTCHFDGIEATAITLPDALAKLVLGRLKEGKVR